MPGWASPSGSWTADAATRSPPDREAAPTLKPCLTLTLVSSGDPSLSQLPSPAPSFPSSLLVPELHAQPRKKPEHSVLVGGEHLVFLLVKVGAQRQPVSVSGVTGGGAGWQSKGRRFWTEALGDELTLAAPSSRGGREAGWRILAVCLVWRYRGCVSGPVVVVGVCVEGKGSRKKRKPAFVRSVS